MAQGLLKAHKTHLENAPLLWGPQGGWASAPSARAQSCTHTAREQVYACTRVRTRTTGPSQPEGSHWTSLGHGALPALSRGPGVAPRSTPPHTAGAHVAATRAHLRGLPRKVIENRPQLGIPMPPPPARRSGSDTVGLSRFLHGPCGAGLLCSEEEEAELGQGACPSPALASAQQALPVAPRHPWPEGPAALHRPRLDAGPQQDQLQPPPDGDSREPGSWRTR